MTVTQYVWDQDNILYETDDNNAVNAEYTYSPEQYGELISEYRGGMTYTHYYDAQGSTLAMTDETGHVTVRFTYNAWGEEVARTGTTNTPWRWIGQFGYLDDSDIGMQIVRRRSYSARIAVWLSIDPLSLTFSLNLFSYVVNSPVLLIDPSGLVWEKLSPNKWRAKESGENLQNLAQQVGADSSDWVCVWPDGPTDNHWVEYPTAECGAIADVRNLTATAGPTRKLGPKITDPVNDGYLVAASNMVGVQFKWEDGSKAATHIRDVANEGANPIRTLYLVGHQFDNSGKLTNLSKGRDFSAHHLLAAAGTSNEYNSYGLAKSHKGPVKCWFARDAKVWGIGCNTNGTWLNERASTVLRKGAVANGTKGVLGAFFSKATGFEAFIQVQSHGIAKNLEQLLRLPDWEKKEGTQ